jgi:hypothetical protein
VPGFDHEHAVRIKLAARGVISAPHREQAFADDGQTVSSPL